VLRSWDRQFSRRRGIRTTLGLIVAIGAQNAFVLRQGIRRHAVGAVVASARCPTPSSSRSASRASARCCDLPSAITVITKSWRAFLLCYGFLAARRAFRPAGLEVAAGHRLAPRAVVTCLALTWLNRTSTSTPSCCSHARRRPGDLRWAFGIGAVLASLSLVRRAGFGRPPAHRLLREAGLVAPAGRLRGRHHAHPPARSC